jgi:predicted amidohydrolase
MTEESRGKYYLTHLIVGPNGVVGFHRKSSLAGGKSGEAAVWDAGNDANVFDIKGFKLGIAICFESVHPQTCQQLKAGGAEVILAPYANGTRPDEIVDPARTQRGWLWERVKENQVWYVACDATPHDEQGQLLSGAAFVISPNQQLVKCTPEDGPPEGMVVVRIPKRVGE